MHSALELERVPVLGVPVDPTTEGDVLAFTRNAIADRRPARIVTVNAEFVMRAQSDRDFHHAIVTADVATPDGAGVVWAMRRQGAKVDARVGGSDLIISMCRQAARDGHRVFLLGARQGVAAAAAEALVRTYPTLDVAGTLSGSPSRDEEEQIVHLIRQSGADILFVAFGAPQQDLWIARNLDAIGVSVAIGVGGSFDYLAGVARRAPKWMRDHNLEWLWRLARQPWRWRRMLALPLFGWRVLRDDPRVVGGERKHT